MLVRVQRSRILRCLISVVVLSIIRSISDTEYTPPCHRYRYTLLDHIRYFKVRDSSDCLVSPKVGRLLLLAWPWAKGWSSAMPRTSLTERGGFVVPPRDSGVFLDSNPRPHD